MKLFLIQNSWSFIPIPTNKPIRFLSFYEYPSYSYIDLVTFLTEFVFWYVFHHEFELNISDISFDNILFLWLLINTQSLVYSSQFFSAWLTFFIYPFYLFLFLFDKSDRGIPPTHRGGKIARSNYLGKIIVEYKEWPRYLPKLWGFKINPVAMVVLRPLVSLFDKETRSFAFC